MDEPEFLDATEVARRLCVSRHQVYKLLEQRQLAYVKVGRLKKIRARSLAEYIARNSIDSIGDDQTINGAPDGLTQHSQKPKKAQIKKKKKD